MNDRSHWLPWVFGVLVLTVGPVGLVGAGLGVTLSDVMSGVFAEATPRRTLSER